MRTNLCKHFCSVVLTVCIIAGFEFAGLSQSVSAAGSRKEKDISQSCTISSSSNDGKQKLTDDNFLTVWKGGKKSTVRIQSPEAIGGLYILWNSIPKKWTLQSMEDPQAPSALFTGGGGSFLHEYVPVQGQNEKDIQLYLETGADIAELYVLGVGEVPGWVQQWQPILDKADMLVVSTHADDELLWFGGTMPVYAGEYQKKVQVSYLTNHGPKRTHELLNGLWTVGIRAYPMISSFPDRYAKTLSRALELYDEEVILQYQVELLRRFKPDVVICQDLGGEYGHGVHQLNARTLSQALHLTNDPAKYPDSITKYGAWEVKKCYLHLYSENRLVMDWSQPLSRFGGKTALDVAKEGLACHASQTPRWQIKDYGDYDCRRFGLYYTTVGKDVICNDFFENVSPCVSWPGLSPADGKTPIPLPTTTTTTLPPTTTTTTAPPETTSSFTTAPITVPQTQPGNVVSQPSSSDSYPVWIWIPFACGGVLLLTGSGVVIYRHHKKKKYKD